MGFIHLDSQNSDFMFSQLVKCILIGIALKSLSSISKINILLLAYCEWVVLNNTNSCIWVMQTRKYT